MQQHYLSFCLPKVGGVNVAAAFLAGTQWVQALIIGKIGQNLLLLLATGVLKEAAGELPSIAVGVRVAALFQISCGV